MITYDDVKDAAVAGLLAPEDAKGKHVRPLLEKGYTIQRLVGKGGGWLVGV